MPKRILKLIVCFALITAVFWPTGAKCSAEVTFPQFDEMLESVSPYIGVSLETIANNIDGMIPNRNSFIASSDDIEYTIGRIGEYFGARRIIWHGNDESMPLMRDVKIGMTRLEVGRLLFGGDSGFADRSFSHIGYLNKGDLITISAQGSYSQMPICITINYLFHNDELIVVVLSVDSI